MARSEKADEEPRPGYAMPPAMHDPKKRKEEIQKALEELDTAEVATRLGVTANAVKIRLHRARQALRELLERELPELRPTNGARA